MELAERPLRGQGESPKDSRRSPGTGGVTKPPIVGATNPPGTGGDTYPPIVGAANPPVDTPIAGAANPNPPDTGGVANPPIIAGAVAYPPIDGEVAPMFATRSM